MSRDMTKPTKWLCAQRRLRSVWASDQSDQSLRCVGCPDWSESSLCAQWVAKDPSFLHADSEDSDQTGRMSRLIWVFAGRTLILLVLSCHGSNGSVISRCMQISEHCKHISFSSSYKYTHTYMHIRRHMRKIRSHTHTYMHTVTTSLITHIYVQRQTHACRHTQTNIKPATTILLREKVWESG